MPRLLVRSKLDGKIRKIDLKVNKFTIGKGKESDLVLDRPGISTNHCALFLSSRDRKFWVRDLGSANGTYLDGKRIVEDAALQHGSRIQVGEFEVLYKLDKKVTSRDLERQEDLKKTLEAEGVKVEEAVPARIASAEGIPVPVEIKKEIHEKLLADRRLRHMDFTKVSEEEARQKTQDVVEEIVKDFRKKIPRQVSNRRLIQEILDEALGLGPLEDLLSDPSVTEIMVNRFDQIYIERNGKIEFSEKRFLEDQQVVQVIQRIIAPIGRLINESSPMVDARLKDGSRVNAVISPLAVSGPSLTIRKFPDHRLTVDDLMRFGSLNDSMSKFLEVAVRERKNIIISGGTGSGKTTLLNVLGAFIPGEERIVTVEDVAELRLPQENVVSLETKPPNLEGEGAVEIRDLVRNSLRMRPDRIVVGECRGGEALDMLQAMNTGHDGSMTTLHANSPGDALGRLETLVLMSGMELPSSAIRGQITSAVDLIVQQSRQKDGSRKVTHVTEMTGLDEGEFLLTDLFRFRPTGIDAGGKIEGEFHPTGHIPDFIHEMNRRGLDVDMRMFGT